MARDESNEKPAPWWTHGHVWLLIAGPGLVVIASFITAWIAISHQDPVLAEDYYRKGAEMSKTLPGGKAMLPALQGRNHAVTPRTP